MIKQLYAIAHSQADILRLDDRFWLFARLNPVMYIGRVLPKMHMKRWQLQYAQDNWRHLTSGWWRCDLSKIQEMTCPINYEAYHGYYFDLSINPYLSLDYVMRNPHRQWEWHHLLRYTTLGPIYLADRFELWWSNASNTGDIEYIAAALSNQAMSDQQAYDYLRRRGNHYDCSASYMYKLVTILRYRENISVRLVDKILSMLATLCDHAWGVDDMNAVIRLYARAIQQMLKNHTIRAEHFEAFDTNKPRMNYGSDAWFYRTVCDPVARRGFPKWLVLAFAAKNIMQSKYYGEPDESYRRLNKHIVSHPLMTPTLYGQCKDLIDNYHCYVCGNINFRVEDLEALGFFNMDVILDKYDSTKRWELLATRSLDIVTRIPTDQLLTEDVLGTLCCNPFLTAAFIRDHPGWPWEKYAHLIATNMFSLDPRVIRDKAVRVIQHAWRYSPLRRCNRYTACMDDSIPGIPKPHYKY